MTVNVRNLMIFIVAVTACNSSDSASDAAVNGDAPARSEVEPIGPVAPKAGGPTKIEYPAPEAAKTKAKEIAGRFAEGEYDRDDETEDNLEAFLWLAASDDDPVRVAEALLAANHLANYEHPPAPFEALLLQRLEAGDARVLDAALQTATHLVAVEHPTEAALPAILAHAKHDDPAIRSRVVEILQQYDTGRAERAHILEMIDSSEDPLVLITALDPHKTMPDASREQYASKCLALLQHPDPGVRGRAALTLARHVPTNDESSRKALEKLLSDDAPYARAAAAEALSSLGATQSIGLVAKLLDDAAPSHHRYELAGPHGKQSLSLSSSKLVKYAAVVSIHRLGSTMGKDKPTFEGSFDFNKESDMERKVELARAWAKRHS